MSQKGHVPIRMCIGCRRTRKKEEMVRFKQGEDGILLMDKKKKLNGRGFYLCPEAACLRLAQKKNQTGRIRKVGRPAGIFDSNFHQKGLAVEEGREWRR